MKKIILVALVALMALPFLEGCKKGPNDPAISLKSRNARITATWKLTKITGTHQGMSMGTAYTTSYAYDGTTYTETTSGSSSSGTGSFQMTIDKDGSIASNESFTPNNGSADVESSQSTWYWFGNDNSKSSIYLTVCGNTLFTSGIYIIDELKSKELILHETVSSNDNGDVYSTDIYYTFEAQ